MVLREEKPIFEVIWEDDRSLSFKSCLYSAAVFFAGKLKIMMKKKAFQFKCTVHCTYNCFFFYALKILPGFSMLPKFYGNMLFLGLGQLGEEIHYKFQT